MKIKTSNLKSAILAIFLLSLFQNTLAGNIAGSAHDFSVLGWSGGEICVACHTPHAADTTVSAPLWNHTVTATNFTMYTSPTLDATSTGQPGGTSRLCLSCHDGTVAIDSFGGAVGGTLMTGRVAVGTGGNLGDDHPISITYDSALAALDGSLLDPSVATATVGLAGGKTKTGTIAAVLLTAGTVQCSSCHDVHNTFTVGAPLLKITTAGSQLCFTCHDK
ncbi:MAG: cytochrome c3 family protein [Gammaproteobacteria bacterium]|nr:cytochrome c3 family protein [Gammaproteobacteria bacterium]